MVLIIPFPTCEYIKLKISLKVVRRNFSVIYVHNNIVVRKNGLYGRRRRGAIHLTVIRIVPIKWEFSLLKSKFFPDPSIKSLGPSIPLPRRHFHCQCAIVTFVAFNENPQLKACRNTEKKSSKDKSMNEKPMSFQSKVSKQK